MVPRGAEARLYLVTVGGSGATKLATPAGHRVNGPTLSMDRRSLIYIDRTANTVRAMAADGTRDQLLFKRLRRAAA